MNHQTQKPEFWETAFSEKQEMWGFEPAKSALIAKDFFAKQGTKNILIPGIGYGRNAQIFLENNIEVTGIEISKTAIELAKKHFGNTITIHYGSVSDMPFSNEKYDGIFCYGLIYLLDEKERVKLLKECFNHLKQNGHMIFTAISKKADTCTQGKFISQDRYEMFGGVRIFFYDIQSIYDEFENFGLVEVLEVEENYPFYLIQCKKDG